MKKGFTLIELLVVLGIIALLVGILLASLMRARATAQSAKCLWNLRTLGTSALVYETDHRDQMPDFRSSWAGPVPTAYTPTVGGDMVAAFSHRMFASPGWVDPTDPAAVKAGIGRALGDYVQNEMQVFRCPSDSLTWGFNLTTPERSSYFWRHALDVYVLSTRKSLKGPTVRRPSQIFAFHGYACHSGSEPNPWTQSDEPEKSINAAFLDGHAQLTQISRKADTGNHDLNWIFNGHAWNVAENAYDF